MFIIKSSFSGGRSTILGYTETDQEVVDNLKRIQKEYQQEDGSQLILNESEMTLEGYDFNRQHVLFYAEPISPMKDYFF